MSSALGATRHIKSGHLCVKSAGAVVMEKGKLKRAKTRSKKPGAQGIGGTKDTEDTQSNRKVNKRSKTLVLGMAFVLTAVAAEAEAKSKRGTTAAPARDRKRLLLLEKMGHDVISCNVGQSENEAEPGKHVSCSFGRRGAISVAASLPVDCKRCDFVFLDYYRFPTAYMHGTYTAVLREMLPKLKQLGVIDEKTAIVVPHLPSLLDHVPPVRNKKGITANDYDLYKATDLAIMEAPHLFNTDRNSAELRSLDRHYPFLLLHY